VVFDELTNGGFELVDEDGLPYGWRKFGGKMAVTLAQRTEGRNGLEFLSDTSSTKWVYQTLRVSGGSYYRASVQASAGEGAREAFLRVSWYASDDGSGEALGSMDSLESSTGSFALLETGAVRAPANARTARVRLMLRPASEGLAAAYFDDVRFGPALAPEGTPTPTRTPGSSATPRPSASPTATGTATPAPTDAPPDEPEVFVTLTNGGFEGARGDGTPVGWHKAGGEMALVSDPRVEGARALMFKSATGSTKWVYETVSVEPGAYYQASVYALKDSAAVEGVFLRLSWYASEDGSGNAVASADSTETLTTDSPSFRMLATGAVLAPDDARSVKVKLMLRPASAAEALAYFDDVRFGEVAAPVATGTLTPTPTPTPGILATLLPPSAPDVFAMLTNGGFEDVDAEGRPVGWDEVGARIGTTDVVKMEGARALEARSSTESTKWVFQTVLVEPGETYELAAYALNVDAREAFLRVSWYASGDGSGEALSSDDSTAAVTAGSGGFGRLTTGAVAAPSEARSAKVRLMLRPGPGAESTAYFDAVTFARAPASVAAQPPAVVQAGGNGSATPGVLGVLAPPGQPVNARPEPVAPPVAAEAGGRGDDWLVYLSLGTAGAALAAAGASEWRRRAERGP